MEEPPPSLEIGEHLRLQRTFWRLQRVAWTLMALIVVAASLGLFGVNGPLSKSVAGDSNSLLEVEYYRFARHVAPLVLKVTVAPGPRPKGQLRLWLGGQYPEAVQIQTVTPQPARVESRGSRLIFTIDAPNPSESARIRLFLQPESIGPVGGTVGLEDGPSLPIRTFVYP